MNPALIQPGSPAPQPREREIHSAPTLGRWRFSIRLLPQASAGGDFYAFASSRWTHELLVGHLSAAHPRYGELVHALLRRIAGKREMSPRARLADCNDFLSTLLGKETSCTAWCGVFQDDGTVAYAGAGHAPPLLRRNGTPIVALPHEGAPFGFDQATTDDHELQMDEGDALLAHTDQLRDFFGRNVVNPKIFAHFSNFERTLGAVAQGNDMLAIVAERAGPD